jgi:hypothetical protein
MVRLGKQHALRLVWMSFNSAVVVGENKVAKSEAQHGSFCFAQHTDDGRCHISMNGTGQHFNVQIPMEQVGVMIDNLLRVQERERQRLFELTVRQADVISEQKHVYQGCLECSAAHHRSA